MVIVRFVGELTQQTAYIAHGKNAAGHNQHSQHNNNGNGNFALFGLAPGHSVGIFLLFAAFALFVRCRRCILRLAGERKQINHLVRGLVAQVRRLQRGLVFRLLARLVRGHGAIPIFVCRGRGLQLAAHLLHRHIGSVCLGCGGFGCPFGFRRRGSFLLRLRFLPGCQGGLRRCFRRLRRCCFFLLRFRLYSGLFRAQQFLHQFTGVGFSIGVRLYRRSLGRRRSL